MSGHARRGRVCPRLFTREIKSVRENVRRNRNTHTGKKKGNRKNETDEEIEENSQGEINKSCV